MELISSELGKLGVVVLMMGAAIIWFERRDRANERRRAREDKRREDDCIQRERALAGRVDALENVAFKRLEDLVQDSTAALRETVEGFKALCDAIGSGAYRAVKKQLTGDHDDAKH